MKIPILLLAVLAASTALAHEGVKNPAVMARMHAMKDINTEFKQLRAMVRGEAALNVETARNATASIATHAARTPGLFEAEEGDPKSEALPVIWERYDDFTAKAREMENVALGLSSSIASESDIVPAFQSLAKTCRACHETYREKKP